MENEKRLIDANNYPCRNCGHEYCDQNCKEFIAWFNNTVDAVEVVRCKDCKHCIWNEDYDELECVRSAEFNDETGQWYGISEFVEENHFCSYGERKDGE